jgi:signal transduction histidine kinase
MRRGAKPAKAKVKAKVSVARTSPKNEASRLRQLQKRLEEALKREAEALEQQTATSEILGVISRSPTDIQPVFDTIVRSSVKLCGATYGLVFRFDGDVVSLVAHHNVDQGALDAYQSMWPRRPETNQLVGSTILQERVLHVHDVAAESRYTLAAANKQALGIRTFVGVPMLRDGKPIGVIGLYRDEIAPFSDRQIGLVKTFASQAVIAIENVRLFTEREARNRDLTEALEQQTATSEILRVISSSPTDVQPVFSAIAKNARRLCKSDSASVLRLDGTLIHLETVDNASEEGTEALRRAYPSPVNQRSAGGRAILTGRAVHIPDVLEDPDYEFAGLQGAGIRSLVSVPMLRHGTAIGAIVVHTWATPRPFSSKQIELLQTFADQAVIAIENVRLFREIADKSAQLEAASRHKSEFLANMSHELRTPLNAIIGFSEVLVDRMFGELNEKQDEYLKDIYASGQHLLSLINDILDLSKIEAGRMELEATDFDLPSAIDNALILVRERASRRGITLGHSVDERLGPIRGDERKVKQVLLNLLSNALKFTPEGGRIDVNAGVHGEVAEVSVADTGVGIAPEDQEAVFEEFRQVGTADKKVEGTGLGLALARKFIELHGGRIWLTSAVGVGSTFTFTLPLRR